MDCSTRIIFDPNNLESFYKALQQFNKKNSIESEQGKPVIRRHSESIEQCISKRTVKVLLRCFAANTFCELYQEAQKALIHLSHLYQISNANASEKLKQGIQLVQQACKLKRNVEDKDLCLSLKIQGKNTQIAKAIQLLELAAVQQNQRALFCLAKLYSAGVAVDKNESKAFQYFCKAKNLGNLAALYHIGNAYLYGKGVQKNESKAAKCFQIAATKGNIDAQFAYADCCMRGIGIDVDEAKGFKYYELAADDHAEALFRLIHCYLFGKGIEKNERLADELYVYWINKESSLALYVQGLAVNDKTVSTNFIIRAAERGLSLAQFEAGVRCYGGAGIEKNIDRARYFFQKAAAQQNVEALFLLGTFYEDGTGVEMSDVIATRLYELAAKQDYSEAQLFFAENLRWGRGINKNKQEALKWYQLAVKNGNVLAQIEFAKILLEGKMIKKDVRQALESINELVCKGNKEAFDYLGSLYKKGIPGFLPQDKAKAASFKKASRNLKISV